MLASTSPVNSHIIAVAGLRRALWIKSISGLSLKKAIYAAEKRLLPVLFFVLQSNGGTVVKQAILVLHFQA